MTLFGDDSLVLGVTSVVESMKLFYKKVLKGAHDFKKKRGKA
jgi:hypothetical protein